MQKVLAPLSDEQLSHLNYVYQNMKNDKNEPLLVEKEELKYILKEIIDDKHES